MGNINRDKAKDVYGVLTGRRFRQGPLPDADRMEIIISQILRTEDGNPVSIMQYWGGCKNPNLGVIEADAAEELTMEHLGRMNEAVKRVYTPGLNINIVTGGKRVERVNGIPHEWTERYHRSLSGMTGEYDFMHAVPICELYDESGMSEECFDSVKERIWDLFGSQDEFGTLVRNASKNIHVNGDNSMLILDKAVRAAKNYIVSRVAEEEAGIFRRFGDSVRASFIRYNKAYRDYIDGETTPPINAQLVFYTSSKGVRIQPWQAIGIHGDGRAYCLTQKWLGFDQGGYFP